ncbi:MAG: hypothetical protein ABI707_02880 [Ferruginibacter sp.]
MSTAIIISFCTLLLLAYVFDYTSSKTKIPSVILLLLLGWAVRQLSQLVGIKIPQLTLLLPILGTIGLILIVLEGSLELELNRSKKALVIKSGMVAFIPLLALAFLMAFSFHYFSHASLRDSLINAIPFCVISSAIAIPSVKNLVSSQKEFIIYESSLSDIFGVLFFNFMAHNSGFQIGSIGMFLLQLILIIIVSFIATVGLSVLLKKIEHPIKFAPIILLIILIYEVSKVYDLPALIFILLFGLFLGNLEEIKRFKWIEKLRPVELSKEVLKFKELIVEATFLIRALFFLLFGYLMETAEIINTGSLGWAAGIVAAIFALRAVQLKISGLPLMPLLFIAPRGLITILLFFSISPAQSIALVNRSLIVQVILLTALVMMYGLLRNNKKIAEVTL